MRISPALIAGVAALGLALPPCAQALETPRQFDKPVREVHLPLPKDPLNPQAKTELSCFYYPDMMIKQVDMGEVGAERISVTPVAAGATPPACVRDQAKNELALGEQEGWEGYYLGNKDDYLVLTSADGSDGGEAFGVFTRAGAKLFMDSSEKMTLVELLPASPHAGSSPIHDKLLHLRYTRVFRADCSVFEKGAACWRQIQKATGLAEPLPPTCNRVYAEEQKRLPANQRKQFISDPTVVGYPVEVTLDGKGIVSPLRPTGKLTGCWPAE